MKRVEVEKQVRLKLLYRLLISYNDFHQAAQIASYIIENRLQHKCDTLRGKRRFRIKMLWQALNCAMIVSYCRPFSGNDRRTQHKIPDLPKRFLRALDPEHRRVHETAMQDRNTLLAHSDSDAWNLRAYFFETAPGRRMLVPVHHDTRAPLIHEAVTTLGCICHTMMDVILEERKRLEQELGGMFPTVPLPENTMPNREQVPDGVLEVLEAIKRITLRVPGITEPMLTGASDGGIILTDPARVRPKGQRP
jgi:hypothetical protein